MDIIRSKIEKFKNKVVTIDELLAFSTENSCSDLYIKAGTKPYINIYGNIIEIPSMPINDLMWNDFAKIAISSENNAKYVREKMLDFSYELEVPEDSRFSGKYSVFRYRVSAGFSRGRYIATFRMITPDPPSFKSINFPPVAKKAIEASLSRKTGIVLISGPTGSGKTTTLASSINDFSMPNQPLSDSVLITLEDPIEYVYETRFSTKITQKEMGTDFRTFSSGMKQALRERPTHILYGEVRDREGIEVCVEASRTGHKVISTFHTEGVASTISRMMFYLTDVGSFNETMLDLITNLDLIVSQRLIKSNSGFKLEVQYMFFVDSIKNMLQKAALSGESIPLVINKLFKDQSLLKRNVVKDWHSI